MRNERGSMLIMSLVVTIFMATVGATNLIRTIGESRIGAHSVSQQRALHAADAAVEQAAVNLRTPGNTLDDDMSGALPTGTFTIDDPIEPLGGDRYQATVHGQSGGAQRHIEAIFEISPESIFQFAVFGDDNVIVTGSAITDSYDSTAGPYGGANVGHGGDIGTNSTVAGGVDLGGSVFIDGQIAVGEGAVDPEAVVTDYDPAFVTGGTSPPSDYQDIMTQSTPFPMPAVSVPEHLACTDASIGGNTTVTLPPGEYCYHNLTINGGGVLTSTGDVKIYLTGELSAQGNSTVGVVNDPTKLLFLVTSTGTAKIENGTLTGDTNFYGGLYGPQATIEITGNAHVFGSIVANRVEVTGSASIHYDEAMSDMTEITSLYRADLISWREP